MATCAWVAPEACTAGFAWDATTSLCTAVTSVTTGYAASAAASSAAELDSAVAAANSSMDMMWLIFGGALVFLRFNSSDRREIIW